MFIAHSEALVQRRYIYLEIYKIPMYVLNIRYVPVISGNHLISYHTNTDALSHMPANSRHEQLYRSYKISIIDLSMRLIHYSAWAMYVYGSLKWNGSRPTFKFLLH